MPRTLAEIIQNHFFFFVVSLAFLLMLFNLSIDKSLLLFIRLGLIVSCLRNKTDKTKTEMQSVCDSESNAYRARAKTKTVICM